jgi:ubiquinone/menaquinone biosynthesis C-methylase UbiE
MSAMSMTGDAPCADYALGHTAREIDRLIDQARFFGDLTERLFRDAGMGPGMRILDIGCGAGDVSFLAARLVGSNGEVIGVDRSTEAIAVASARAVQSSVTNVRFIVSELDMLTLPEPVDMVVGRLILMYVPDPTVLVRPLKVLVKLGGVLAFQEFDLHGATSEPPCPLVEVTVERILRTFTSGGIGVRTGLQLGRIFEDAGLGPPTMLAAARVERGPNSRLYRQLADVTRAVLPLMTRIGVASAEEIDIETLEARLRDEAVARNATLVAPPLIGAWARNG